MIDLQDKRYCPSMEEIDEYVNNPAFSQFCSYMKEQYVCKEKIEFSSCSWMPGWNIKFKNLERICVHFTPMKAILLL